MLEAVAAMVVVLGIGFLMAQMPLDIDPARIGRGRHLQG